MGVGHVLLARSSITIMGLVVTPVAAVSGPMTGAVGLIVMLLVACSLTVLLSFEGWVPKLKSG